MARVSVVSYIGVLMLVLGSACAPKAAPPVAAGAPKHSDFIFPAAPAGTAAALSQRIDRGWAYLQLDDTHNAEREFAAALKEQPSFYPAETALAYLSMARSNERDAAARFERALQADAGYVPALVGRGQALLQLERDDEALASFEAALAKDPSLTELRSRVEVLRFRATQTMLGRAKAAADARRWDEAAAIYQKAIAASPDSAFLYRDLAGVEQKAGQSASALTHYRKAVELDGSDAKSLAAVGAILEAQGDAVGALDAYTRAHAIDANEVPDAAIGRLRGAAALAKLPEQYRAIPSAPAVNRAEVAALIGVRLDTLLARTQPRQLVITDVRGHWAQPWILPVVRSGVMETLPNYEFEPARDIRRGEMAAVVARILGLIGAVNPAAAKKWQGAHVTINDVAPSHLSYPAVSTAVASGVMTLSNGNFELLRTISGAEAAEIVSRLEALSRQ